VILIDVLAALLIAVGLVGVLVPMLPGSSWVGAVVLVWAVIVDEPAGWWAFAVAAALLVTGAVVKYAVPGKRLKQSGVPNRTLLLGAVLGVVGFFVIPVVGLPIGFVLGVYLAERARLPHDQAWPATVAALRAVGVSILIELGFCLLAAGAWLAGAVAT
jgi:uncharacterized protein YqgC (DUF456 family)